MGTKLQVIITKLGLRIAERGDVVKGTPVVEPANDLFWFNRPHLILFLINFVLFLVFLSYIYSIYLCLILSGSHNTMAHSNYAYATSVLFLKSQNAFQLAFFAWSTVSNWLKPLSFLPLLIFGVSHGLFFSDLSVWVWAAILLSPKDRRHCHQNLNGVSFITTTQPAYTKD